MIWLEIYSMQKVLFKGEVSKVRLPGQSAPFTVLPLHGPIISALTQGTVSYVTPDGADNFLKVGGGYVMVLSDNVKICIE